MDYLRQAVASKGLKNDVHVVGHNAPSKQAITLAIKMLQIFGYNFGQFEFCKNAFSTACV